MLLTQVAACMQKRIEKNRGGGGGISRLPRLLLDYYFLTLSETHYVVHNYRLCLQIELLCIINLVAGAFIYCLSLAGYSLEYEGIIKIL